MDFFQSIISQGQSWWHDLSSIDPETSVGVTVLILATGLFLWATARYLNRPLQTSVPLSKEERKAQRKANRDELKALLVTRNYNAAVWAIDEGLKSAVFDRRMSKAEANRWRVKYAEAFGMAELLPYHKRYRFTKLHPIKNAILKLDLESRIKTLKKEKPVKLPDAAKTQFKAVYRQQRIAKNHNGATA